MLLLSIMFVLWKTSDSCKEGCQPGSSILCLPIHDTILAQHSLETSELPLAFCHSIPRLLKIKIFLSEKATFPAGQQLRKKGARQVMSAQANNGWLTLHACRVHPGVFSEKASKGREGKCYFLENAFFNLLIPSVKSAVHLHYIVFRAAACAMTHWICCFALTRAVVTSDYGHVFIFHWTTLYWGFKNSSRICC